MFCPQCASPIDGTQKFCRACGANVSLVPQALTGQLPPAAPTMGGRRRHPRHRQETPVSIEQAASTFFTGLGFVFVAFAVRYFAPAGQIWWFWLLIPAFVSMGKGIGTYLKWKELQRAPQSPPPASHEANAVAAPPPAAELSPAPTTSQLAAPVSVVEHTTKHLDPSR
jgi:hypothetical protein